MSAEIEHGGKDMQEETGEMVTHPDDNDGDDLIVEGTTKVNETQQNHLGDKASHESYVLSTQKDVGSERNDSSSLFIPEGGTPEPTGATSNKDDKEMENPTPAATARPMSRPSKFEKIRMMQKRVQEKKNASTKRTSYPSDNHPDDEAYLEAVLTPITPAPGHVPDLGDEMEDRKAFAEFEKKRHHYDKLRRENGGELPLKDDIQWMRIKGTEEARRKKRARDIAQAREEEGIDMFPGAQNATDEEDENDATSDFLGHPRKRPRHNPRKAQPERSMQEAELESMKVALNAEEDLPSKARKCKSSSKNQKNCGPSNGSARGKGSVTRASKSKSKPAASTNTKNSGSGRKTAKSKREADQAVKQVTSLFNSNVFEQQASRLAAEQPSFRSRRKDDALKELIASVPVGDKKKAKSDMNILLNATKDFNGKGAVKADGGLWRVKGMSTSLKPYQVLGTAFMRRRENDFSEPRGGLLADQMGLGKTLMMLANIVNGCPLKGEKGPKTTLLVASPSLLSQWKSEIEQHTDVGFKVIRYTAGYRFDTNCPEKTLLSHDIVLTTYQEVMKSYPKNEPPIECQTAEEKMAWWKAVYDKHRGLLHRVRFLRVVLDEAQAIKNHLGRTSIACRALIANHKWALSGTPIVNSLTELYPYFKFLNVPHTGSFKIFKQNYCGTGEPENTERLLVRLAQFMLRRTHADEMFGAPILKLPQADQSTLWCDFNLVERCIYDIVRVRFAKRINMWSKKGTLDSSYGNALVMLLRLRQLTAHILMLQFVMRDLLEREDIERIREVVGNQIARVNDQQGGTIIAVRKQLEKLAQDEKNKRAAKDKSKSVTKSASEGAFEDSDTDLDAAIDDPGEAESAPTQEAGRDMSSGGDFGKDFDFRPYLNSLQDGKSWEKAKKRARCCCCDKQPKNPFISSCGHLICREPCLDNQNLWAAENGHENAPCRACGVVPTFYHPCEADVDELAEPMERDTRASKKKQNEKQRGRPESDDIREDWLARLGDDVLPSAKTIAVKSQILNWIKENPRVKVIIYTQFLAMIRILARVCRNEGWEVEQYHGKMSLSARDKAIANFAENNEVQIMLASLRCGGLGLNLTMASKVIIVDPWWNSAVEQQAFCRVFRIGQLEETWMSRMCVKHTVDHRLIEMQKRKQAEIDSVMEEDGSRLKKMGMPDLMRLFGNLQEDSDGRPFIMVDNPDSMGGFRADRDDEGYADDM